MAFQVIAPLVQVRKADGGYAHVYEEGFLPDDADADHIAHLVEMGMVAEVDPEDEQPAKGRGKKS